jgi:hypothetical protein
MARKAVSLEELFSVLGDEFARARPSACRACVTPLPIRRAPADDVSSNWFVVEAEDCPHQCRVVLAEIVTRLMSEYELERTVYGATRSARKPARQS